MFIKLLAMKEAYLSDILSAFRKDERGATAIEYGLIAGGISLAIVTAVFLFGDELSGLFDTLADKMADAADRAAEEE